MNEDIKSDLKAKSVSLGDSKQQITFQLYDVFNSPNLLFNDDSHPPLDDLLSVPPFIELNTLLEPLYISSSLEEGVLPTPTQLIDDSAHSNAVASLSLLAPPTCSHSNQRKRKISDIDITVCEESDDLDEDKDDDVIIID